VKLHIKQVHLNRVRVRFDEVDRGAALVPGVHANIFGFPQDFGQMKFGPFSLELFT
jgi:hypothetical protein